MNDNFDSRALGKTDCYGQRFMKVGTYRYHVLPVGGDRYTDERPYMIKVVERRATTKMNSHNVAVTQVGHFHAEPGEITIEAGDMVLWNCCTSGAQPYIVVGDKEFFNSARLVNESGYTHAFGTPGEFEWVDVHGGKASGIVRVKNPACKDAKDVQRWRNQLSKGTIVMISDGKVEPQQVEIMVGQTVFFAVVNGVGISITDRRIAGMGAGDACKAPAKRSERSAK